jgi:maleate isomerase
MSVAYARKGLYGVLTPQANTTVEPELAVLTPVGYGWINGRLTSPKPSIEARLVDYYDTLHKALGQFANAPLGVIGVACTGASYLVGAERERALVGDWSRAAKVPVITTGDAVTDVLRALGAQRIALVSPYGPSLDAAAVPYWQSRGFTIARLANAFRAGTDFHPIYSLGHSAADAALDSLQAVDVDAVLMLGTGMPTLQPILTRRRIGQAPIVSCMLCLAIAIMAALDRRPIERASVLSWIAGEPWGGRARLAVEGDVA